MTTISQTVLIVHLQVLLALLTIGPWAVFIIYDLILYITRAVTYEVPYVGGRARGRQRPRAPSLTERPSGRPRTFSLTGLLSSPGEAVGTEGIKHRSSASGSRKRIDMVNEAS